jgi:hypothetical protein
VLKLQKYYLPKNHQFSDKYSQPKKGTRGEATPAKIRKT